MCRKFRASCIGNGERHERKERGGVGKDCIVGVQEVPGVLQAPKCNEKGILSSREVSQFQHFAGWIFKQQQAAVPSSLTLYQALSSSRRFCRSENIEKGVSKQSILRRERAGLLGRWCSPVPVLERHPVNEPVVRMKFQRHSPSHLVFK